MKTHETSPTDDPAKVVIIDGRSLIKVSVLLLHELPPSFPKEHIIKISKIMYDLTSWTLNT